MIVRDSSLVSEPAKHLLELIQGCNQSGLVNDPLAAHLLNHVQLDPEDQAVWKLLAEMLEGEVIRKVASQEPFHATCPRSQHQLQGDMVLGIVRGRENIEFRLSSSCIPRHTLICGTSGTGKTFLSMRMAEQAYLNSFGPIRIFDPKIQEFLTLAKKYPDFLAWLRRHLRINPFMPPPNVPLDEWLQVIVGHMAQCFNFWEGGESLLLSALSSSFRRNGTASVRGMLRYLEDSRNARSFKSAAVRDTVMSRLEIMWHGLGDVVESEGSMLEALSGRNLILSTAGLMSELESWLVEFLLIWEFMYRAHNPGKRVPALHIYDECQHRLFNAEKERNIKKISSSQISKMIDEARAMGLGCCSLSQEPSTLIKPVVNNSYTKICMHLGSGSEVKVMKEAMGLTDEQANALHYLETGQAVVRLAGGWMEPFAVQLNQFEAPSDVDEEEFWRHQARLKEELYREAGLDGGSEPAVGQPAGGPRSDGGGPGGPNQDPRRQSRGEDYDRLG